LIDWENKEKRLIELFSAPEKYSESQIAAIMTEEYGEEFSRDAVHNKIARLDLRVLTSKPITDIMPYYTKYMDLIKSETTIEKAYPLPQNQNSIELVASLKILHLGDLHIPFQEEEQVQTAINRNQTADIVVTTEVADCYSISRFNKNMSVPFEVEVDNIIRFFETVNATFPLTFVMSGNHDKRIIKDFMRGVTPELLFLVQEDLLTYLAKPFPRITVVKHPIFQINDCIFTHAEYFSKLDMRAGVNVNNFLTEWKEVLDLKDYRCVLQSHTHMLGSTYRGGNVKIIETGCLTRVPDYAVNAFYSKPQTNGYVVVKQDMGVTNFDLTREYVFPPQKYIPHWAPTSLGGSTGG
jgi:hypothetical protein